MLSKLLSGEIASSSLTEVDRAALADELGRRAGAQAYPRSVTAQDGVVYFLGRRGVENFLGTVASDESLTLVPANHDSAATLRQALPWLRPQLLGLRTSAGLGDRLGLATPGHVRAVRAAGGRIAPIFAQQSIREMTRTGRTPQQVMDDALWGVFQEGWQDGFGADADHLKTPEDVDACVAAGFTFYTIDPGDHVDDAADTDDRVTLMAKMRALPWDVLEDTPADLDHRYLFQEFALADGSKLAFSEPVLLRALVKYGRAVAHTVRLYRHLAEAMGRRGDKETGRRGTEHTPHHTFELEMSVDETATPTSPHEHFFVASELRRLGVRWVSLAPRYVGRFEKGVDYIGNLSEFEADFAVHAAIARHFGPYKLSLHSGSDKFSLYPIVARLTGGLVHLKTAGTSYLEALRTIAALDPALFRAIYAFARERYPTDRASYHVSASLERAPLPQDLSAADPSAGSGQALPTLLDQFDARQVLHVTFGSVLTDLTGLRDLSGLPEYRFRDRLLAALKRDEEAYYAALEAHFRRHLQPFLATSN
jgi:hypothetical protein